MRIKARKIVQLPAAVYTISTYTLSARAFHEIGVYLEAKGLEIQSNMMLDYSDALLRYLNDFCAGDLGFMAMWFGTKEMYDEIMSIAAAGVQRELAAA